MDFHPHFFPFRKSLFRYHCKTNVPLNSFYWCFSYCCRYILLYAAGCDLFFYTGWPDIACGWLRLHLSMGKTNHTVGHLFVMTSLYDTFGSVFYNVCPQHYDSNCHKTNQNRFFKVFILHIPLPSFRFKLFCINAQFLPPAKITPPQTPPPTSAASQTRSRSPACHRSSSYSTPPGFQPQYSPPSASGSRSGASEDGISGLPSKR